MRVCCWDCWYAPWLLACRAPCTLRSQAAVGKEYNKTQASSVHTQGSTRCMLCRYNAVTIGSALTAALQWGTNAQVAICPAVTPQSLLCALLLGSPRTVSLSGDVGSGPTHTQTHTQHSMHLRAACLRRRRASYAQVRACAQYSFARTLYAFMLLAFLAQSASDMLSSSFCVDAYTHTHTRYTHRCRWNPYGTQRLFGQPKRTMTC